MNSIRIFHLTIEILHKLIRFHDKEINLVALWEVRSILMQLINSNQELELETARVNQSVLSEEELQRKCHIIHKGDWWLQQDLRTWSSFQTHQQKEIMN